MADRVLSILLAVSYKTNVVLMFLSSENKRQFYVPEGFAHGFVVLSDVATFNYKCTDFYAPEYDSGLLWTDPEVGIEWPLEGIEEIILSEKDKKQNEIHRHRQKNR